MVSRFEHLIGIKLMLHQPVPDPDLGQQAPQPCTIQNRRKKKKGKWGKKEKEGFFGSRRWGGELV